MIARHETDLAALVCQGEYVKADPLPADLAEAARDVAHALGLPANWLNAGPTSIVDTAFPDGFASRVEVRQYGRLILDIASRFDQIHLKLYAGQINGREASTRTISAEDALRVKS